ITELMRLPATHPDLEADAIARPDKLINPVDLGTILVPSDWLLMGPGQKAIIEVASIAYHRSIADGHVKAWFESLKKAAEANLKLDPRARVITKLELGPITPGQKQDILHVAILDSGGRELWQKQIRTMFVARPLQLPAFGAFETKLRYDAPISVRDAKS